MHYYFLVFGGGRCLLRYNGPERESGSPHFCTFEAIDDNVKTNELIRPQENAKDPLQLQPGQHQASRPFLDSPSSGLLKVFLPGVIIFPNRN